MIIIYFLILFIVIGCQKEAEVDSSNKNGDKNELFSDFNECLVKYGINIQLKNKEEKIKDDLNKNIIDSFRQKMEKKENEEIIKECRKKSYKTLQTNLKKKIKSINLK